jgi:hypothetical protein
MKANMKVVVAATAFFSLVAMSALNARPQEASAPVPAAAANTPHTVATAPATAAPSREATVASLLKPMDGVTYLPDSVVGVVLSTTTNDVRLEATAGALASTNAFVTRLFFADFPGQHAAQRIADPRPTLHIKLATNPKGRVFLVKVEVNDGTNNRSLKMGKSSFASFSSATTPDTDWIMGNTVKEEAPGLWAITPNADLPPDEYGVFVARAGGGDLSGDLYDFAVVGK